MNREKQVTKKWIEEALFRLLKKRNYDSITIQNIADEARIGRRSFYRYFSSKDAVLEDTIRLYMSGLGDYFQENLSDRAEDIAFCYFSYWEQNIDFLLTMQKAGLAYRLPEYFEAAVHDIAGRIGHVPFPEESQSLREYHERHKFAFGFRLAGYWKVTELWSQENPRRSAGEMRAVMNAILWGEKSQVQAMPGRDRSGSCS